MPDFGFELVPFAAGPLRQSDADRLNLLVREIGAVLRLNTDWPLAHHWHADSLSLTCQVRRLAVQDTRYSTLLTADLDSESTTLTVQSFALFPATDGFSIRIDDEVLTVTAGAGSTTWTVTRDAGGTGAVAHDQWSVVSLVLPDVTTTLADDLTDEETTLTVAGMGTGRFPSEDRFYATIGTEIVYVTKTNGTDWTIERGAFHTVVPATHASGATVTQVLFNELVDVDRIIFERGFVQPGGARERTAIVREVCDLVEPTGPASAGYTPAILIQRDGAADDWQDDVEILLVDGNGLTLKEGQRYLGRLVDNHEGQRVYAVVHQGLKVRDTETPTATTVDPTTTLTFDWAATVDGGFLDVQTVGGDAAEAKVLWRGLLARRATDATVGPRRRISFIPGTGITITVADDASDKEIDVTIATTAPTPSNAKVHGIETQTVEASSTEAVIGNEEDWDTDAFWDAGSPTRFTFPAAGKYHVDYQIAGDVEFSGSVTVDPAMILSYLRVEGTTAVANSYDGKEVSRLALTSGGSSGSSIVDFAQVYLQGSTDVEVEAGDYIEVMVQNNATVDFIIDGPRTGFSVHRIA